MVVCTADDLLGWGDFPKGLRVLLLDEDNVSAAEIKSQLEEMDYIVSTFCNEDEALSAISSKPESFHVAIVEVSTSNRHGSFRFLETVKDLPTIMTSNIHCWSTTMKCIALGAVEFLQKPLSEEKLRNIWQHVVHKAFNARGSCLSESVLKPVKETVASMLQLQIGTGEDENGNIVETENLGEAQEIEQPAISDKFAAPSTPQLKQGARSLDDVDCQDPTNCLMEKDGEEQDGESKSVENTCNDLVTEDTIMVETAQRLGESVIKEEDDSVSGSNTGSNVSPHLQNKDQVVDFRVDDRNRNKASPIPNFYGTRANKKKMKVDWTPELHKRFVQAVEQLGVDQAIPSRILELMKVEGLTRHNVASHLQKFRMHRRHILPKEEDRRFQQLRDPLHRGYPQKPLMAFPPYHYNHSQIYPVWGHPSNHPSGVQMWGTPAYPTWQPTETWPWKTYPPMQADAWGCPVMPQHQYPCSTFSQNASGFHCSDAAVEDLSRQPPTSFDLYPEEEVIDKIVREAISKPWLPLPLGLKPPSTESVLSELHSQGISNIPPGHLTYTHSC